MKQLISRRLGARIATAAAGLMTAVAVLAIPSVASAEPAGCNHDVDFWTTAVPNDGNLLHTDSFGWCNTGATRTLRVENKANLWPSDAVVSSQSVNGSGTSYYAHTQTCDGGQRKEYYGRAFFTQSPTWKDDGYVTITTCH